MNTTHTLTARVFEIQHSTGRADLPPLDSHCSKPGCTCKHTVCYRGWIDTTEMRDTRPHAVTSPCWACRPDSHARHLRAIEAMSKGLPSYVVQNILRTSDRG